MLGGSSRTMAGYVNCVSSSRSASIQEAGRYYVLLTRRVTLESGWCARRRPGGAACQSKNWERSIDIDQILADTRRWLERSVIGLNLCPFAAAPYRDDRVYFRVSEQRTASGLLEELRSELLSLHAADPLRRETTLLIHPWVLTDFIEYNDFLEVCETTVDDLQLEGELQVASFHPQYQFANTQPEDIGNYTNRSPYPMLHLLREASIGRAIAGGVDTEEIYRRNIRTMQELGHSGWQRLWRD
jgi:uncharacterized protein